MHDSLVYHREQAAMAWSKYAEKAASSFGQIFGPARRTAGFVEPGFPSEAGPNHSPAPQTRPRTP